MPQPQEEVALGFLMAKWGAHERVGVIQLRTAQQVEAAWVHQNTGARLLDHQIIRGGWRLIEVELVLKAATAPCEHGHPQCGGRGLASQYL